MAKKKEPSNKTSASAAAEVPKQRKCGAMGQHFYLLETVASFRTNQVSLEHACQANLRTHAVARVTPYKINVVVHVVHNLASCNTSASSNTTQSRYS